MTTVSPLRPGSGGTPPTRAPRTWWQLLATDPETPQARASRLRMR